MADKQKKNACEIYEIKIQGHLDTKWSEWFYGMTITHERDGTTTLCGSLPDQAVLHSILNRIRDMNLPLISVNQIVSDGQTIHHEVKGGVMKSSPTTLKKSNGRYLRKEKRTMKTNRLSKSTRLNEKRKTEP